MLCRFLNEVIQIKFRAFGQDDEQAEYALYNLLTVLTSCISSLQQRQHRELIAEIYTIPLWQCGKVQFMLDFACSLSLAA